jgi:methionyl aminopeptidase
VRAMARATPGTTTAALNAFIADDLAHHAAEPAFRDESFPGAASITINEEVAHAPPGPRILRAGDIVTIDAAIRLNGWCADAAACLVIGPASPDAARLIQAAREATSAAIGALQPGRRWSEAAAAAVRAASAHGCSVLSGFAGHGIGQRLQEPPSASFPDPGGGQEPSTCQDFVLRPGMVLTVEPLLILGRPVVLGLDDAWTVVTADRSAAAHEERTVAVTRSGPQVLTAR